MQPFTYEALPGRVVFGFDTSDRIAEEVERLNCKTALVLSTPNQAAGAEKLRTMLGGVGKSGYGREMGFDAMREYTQVKSVWINVDAEIPPYFRR